MADDSILTGGSEVAVIAGLAREQSRVETLDPAADAIGVRVLDSEAYHVLNLEQLRGTPDRPRGAVALTEPASFVAYVRRHETQKSVLYASRQDDRVVAVLNDHAPAQRVDGSPGWCDHRADLVLQRTAAWKAWEALDRKMIDQGTLAEFIEEHAADFEEPSGADMLEIASTLQARIGADFKSAVRLATGEVQFSYTEAVDARAGRSGEATIPTTFTIVLPVWEGTAPYRVEARFRYRVRSGELQMGFLLSRVDDVLRAAFLDITSQIEAAVTSPILHGKFVQGPRNDVLNAYSVLKQG